MQHGRDFAPELAEILLGANVETLIFLCPLQGGGYVKMASAHVVNEKVAQSSPDRIKRLVEGGLEATRGLLRLAPCWVPRSFLQPGKRLKLHPDDLYAFG